MNVTGTFSGHGMAVEIHSCLPYDAQMEWALKWAIFKRIRRCLISLNFELRISNILAFSHRMFYESDAFNHWEVLQHQCTNLSCSVI